MLQLVIYRKYAHRAPSTAYLPQDAPKDRYSSARIARFQPEEEIDGGTLNMRTGELKSRRWTEPDRVNIDHGSFAERLHLLVCKHIRIMTEADANAVKAIDEDMAALKQKYESELRALQGCRDEVLEAAWKRSRPLHQRDVDPTWGGASD